MLTSGQRQALDELHAIADYGGPRVVHVATTNEYGAVSVDVEVACAGIDIAKDGLKLRRAERLRVSIPANFPFGLPTVATPHTRWAGFPHVEFGNQICLYRSPAVEWNPADGMFGFVERVHDWLRSAAAGQLDPTGAAMHPPVAYDRFGGGGSLVIQADAPRAAAQPWLGVALIRRVSGKRLNVVGWAELGREHWLEAATRVGLHMNEPWFGAAALVLPEPIGFTMPYTARMLAAKLADQGISHDLTLGLLGMVADFNANLAQNRRANDGYPLYGLVGTPSRGVVGEGSVTHLAAWRLPDDLAPLLAAVPAGLTTPNNPTTVAVGESVLSKARGWLNNAPIHWTTVYEMREETTVPRDQGSASRWLVGRRVLVLGAGALGAPIAEACVRSGAGAVTVIDNSCVHPGIIIRQPYNDVDIGEPKATLLVQRLKNIRPDTQVTAFVADAVTKFFQGGAPAPDVDLIVDATADNIVRHAIETRRRESAASWPAVISVLIGHDARRGIATVNTPSATGASVDILRRVGIAARLDATGGLDDVTQDFYADPPRTEMFQPEPGCSSPTFRGSAAEVSGLAGQLLSGALSILRDDSEGVLDAPMHALIVRMPPERATPKPVATGAQWLSWPADTIIPDQSGRYEVRVTSTAAEEMRAECRRGARLRGSDIETGGILLGRFDDAARVVWVDIATGPPPDSRLSATHFERGSAGVAEVISARMKATKRASGYVGEWHAHPGGPAHPSSTDAHGMAYLVRSVIDAPRRALLLIVGGDGDVWQDWLQRDTTPDWYADVVDRSSVALTVNATPRPSSVQDGASWWPGGYVKPQAAIARRSRIAKWRRWHYPRRWARS